MTTLKTSMSFFDSRPGTTLPAGVHTMAEIMPAVLAAHGLSMSDDANVRRPVAESEHVTGHARRP